MESRILDDDKQKWYNADGHPIAISIETTYISQFTYILYNIYLYSFI